MATAHSNRPIHQLLDLLSRRWTLRILWELRAGRLTFRELRERCDDVSPTSLNARLKDLRALALVDHADEGFGYTEWGEAVSAQLLALDRLADAWWKEHTR